MKVNLPRQFGPERNAAILARVRESAYDPIPIAVIRSEYQGHTGEFQVFADALRMDGVRINVSAEGMQQVADILGYSLLTPMLADLMWQQREVSLTPCVQPIDDSTAAMEHHSERIDAQLEALGNPAGLFATVGKLWLIDDSLLQHPGMALNYGWPFQGPKFQGMTGEVSATQMKDQSGAYVRVLQGLGWRHNPKHADYSQICVCTAQVCMVDGQPWLLHNLLRDPVLAHLASHTGAMKVLRQPGVAELA